MATAFASTAAATEPADACAAADSAADVAARGGWYESCVGPVAVVARPALDYTQRLVGCSLDGRSCTYEPTFHASLEALGGSWRLRATSEERAYPSGALVAGSQRALECVVAAGAASCRSSTPNAAVVGSTATSAQWRGAWELRAIDPLGGERVVATGIDAGWLAQYCLCEG